MANAWIGAIIYGGAHHLDCLTATQLLRVVATLVAIRVRSLGSRARVAPCTAYASGSRTEVGQKLVSGIGLILRIFSTFTCLTRDSTISQSMHTLRDGWKLLGVGISFWMEACRHEAPQIAQPMAWRAAEDQLQEVAADHWSRCCRKGSRNACYSVASVVQGQGTHSQPSLFVVLRDFGSWAHLCWLCPQSPLISHRLLPLPSTLLIRSLGWTSGGQEVLMYMYMAMIQKVLWHEQHGRAWGLAVISLHMCHWEYCGISWWHDGNRKRISMWCHWGNLRVPLRTVHLSNWGSELSSSSAHVCRAVVFIHDAWAGGLLRCSGAAGGWQFAALLLLPRRPASSTCGAAA